MPGPEEDNVDDNLSPSPAQAQAPGPESDTGNSFMAAATSKALRPFVIISSSYLLFTITDGAMRTIVLLHAFNKSFSAWEVAVMFTLYELAGVFTNLVSSFCDKNKRLDDSRLFHNIYDNPIVLLVPCRPDIVDAF